MKALWRYDNGILGFKEIEEPQIQSPSEVKIKVMYSMIGIQDLRMSREWDFYAKPGIAGYEMSGIIVELGENAAKDGFYVGQCVTGTIAKFCGRCIYCLRGEEHNCLQPDVHSGTICEYVVWESTQIIPLSQTTPFSIGSLLEPVAVVNMAFQKFKLTSCDKLCILGGDFNGLLMLQLAQLKGITDIVVVEPKEYNRSLAYSLGASYVINPLDDTFETELLRLSDFIGYPAVAITSSNPMWLQTAMNITARGGTIMITVYFDLSKDISINSIKFFAMNLDITSSFLYSKKVLIETKDLLPNLQLKELIAKEYPVKAALQAFELEHNNYYPRIGLDMKQW